MRYIVVCTLFFGCLFGGTSISVYQPADTLHQYRAPSRRWLPIKNTLGNTEYTEEFVMNIVSLTLSNTIYESSKIHPPKADEFEKAGFTPVAARWLTPPGGGRGESMECILDWVLTLVSDRLVLGHMVRFHIREGLYEIGRINVTSMNPLGRFTVN